MLFESMIASVLAPAAVEAVKGIFGAVSRKFVGLSVDDQIKLESAQIERLKAIAALDTPIGVPSQWVVDLRSSSRYLAVAACLLIGSSLFLFAPELAEVAAQLIAIPFSFLFGERMLLSLKGK